MHPESRRTDGFVPIEDYAVLGDGRTVALVALDGRIDWWPIPTIDAPPICAALLAPGTGGFFSLRPEGTFESRRSYVDRTNVLETVFTTPTGAVRVTESLNTGASGRLPWTELARRVDGLDGRVSMRWELVPGNRFETARPWVHQVRGVPMIQVGDQNIAVIVGGSGGHGVAEDADRVTGTLDCRAGERALVAAVATDHEPLFVPTAESVQERLDRTVREWRRWSTMAAATGRWAEAELRSALALKTLLFEREGSLAAAATTSLPERLGGPKNWDYRYSWLRDLSFAVDALIHLGLHEEVHSSVSWMLGALRRSAPELQVFYRLDGTTADEQAELHAAGYRASRPVRAGNRAAGQLQLGVYGDVFDTLDRYLAEGHVLDSTTATLLAGLADQCCDRWMQPDSGIWELEDLRHYTVSKIGCWVALDRAGRMADAGHLPALHSGRWHTEARRIREWVGRHCWSEAEQSYTFYAGTDGLDAAVLLSGRTGFDAGPRLAATVEAVERHLRQGPLVYRYSGMRGQEGAFVACSFWLVDAMARVGRLDDARRLMDETVRMANDVGLLSEEIDPPSGRFLGNMPQGLSHLALISAARAVEELSARSRAPRPTPAGR